MRENIHSSAQRHISVMGCLLMALLLSLTACTRHGDYDALLRTADSLVNVRPDSVIQLLEPLGREQENMATAQRMRWQLLLTSAQNKCDILFHSDSLQLELVKYYDRYGTPNERMTAHYLLGRAYSDMGQSPEAMHSYQEALQSADTTATNCDWWNYSRICLQLSTEYYDSYMPYEMLGVLRNASLAALRGGDTITSVIALCKEAGAYELLGQTDSLSIVNKEAARKFQSLGRDDLASQCLSILIEDEAEKGNIDSASLYVKYYEGSSGYFDGNNEIEEGREIYYYSKGVYYLYKAQSDSAEWVFRKLLSKSKDTNDRHAAYLGLTKTFMQTGPLDSLAKYAILCEQSNDTLYQDNYKANVQLLQRRFDYSRHVENEQQLKLDAERKSRLIQACVFTFLILTVILLSLFLKKKREKEMAIKEYEEDLNRLQKLKTELSILVDSKEKIITELSQESIMQQTNLDTLRTSLLKMTEKLQQVEGLASDAIKAKDEEINSLLSKYQKVDKLLSCRNRDDVIRKMLESTVVKQINFYLTHPINRLPEKIWSDLDNLFFEMHPNYLATLRASYNISAKEYKVCQLIFLGYSPSSIAVILGYDKSNVTNLRKRLHAKLTGKRGKAKDLDNYLFSIPVMSI